MNTTDDRRKTDADGAGHSSKSFASACAQLAMQNEELRHNQEKLKASLTHFENLYEWWVT